MVLDADALVDRRRLKRHLTFWRTLAIVIAVALIAVAVGRFTGYQRADYIARIHVRDIILDDDRRHHALDLIARDASAKALVVRIDSGSTIATQAATAARRSTGRSAK